MNSFITYIPSTVVVEGLSYSTAGGSTDGGLGLTGVGLGLTGGGLDVTSCGSWGSSDDILESTGDDLWWIGDRCSSTGADGVCSLAT